MLPRLGWREDGLGKVREFASGWSGKDEEWAEALSFTMHEMVGYETIRAFGGIDLAMSGGRHSGFWEKTEGLSFGDLFSPPNERVSAVPNYLFGPQMGCRFILQGLAEEWGDLRGGRPTPMADEGVALGQAHGRGRGKPADGTRTGHLVQITAFRLVRRRLFSSRFLTDPASATWPPTACIRWFPKALG